MTPDLWRAKKIVDSTLHPGMLVCNLLEGAHLMLRVDFKTLDSQFSYHGACRASFLRILWSPRACSLQIFPYVLQSISNLGS